MSSAPRRRRHFDPVEVDGVLGHGGVGADGARDQTSAGLCSRAPNSGEGSPWAPNCGHGQPDPLRISVARYEPAVIVRCRRVGMPRATLYRRFGAPISNEQLARHTTIQGTMPRIFSTSHHLSNLRLLTTSHRVPVTAALPLRPVSKEKSPGTPISTGFAGLILWRYRWDLNPRWSQPPHMFSRHDPSAARTRYRERV